MSSKTGFVSSIFRDLASLVSKSRPADLKIVKATKRCSKLTEGWPNGSSDYLYLFLLNLKALLLNKTSSVIDIYDILMSLEGHVWWLSGLIMETSVAHYHQQNSLVELESSSDIELMCCPYSIGDIYQ